MQSSNVMFLQLLVWCSSFALVLSSNSCPQASKCVSLLEKGKSCPLFPMIPGTFDAPVRSQGYNLTKLRPGVFHYSDDAYHAMFMYSSISSRLVVIDFPRSANSVTPDGTYLLTTATMELLNGQSPSRVDMVYSHRHTDHIGSAGVYKTFIANTFPDAKISVWGTSEAKTFIQRDGLEPRVPLPTVIIGGRTSKIKLSPNLILELSILGGHTNHDVLAFIPKSSEGNGVVHYVDVIQTGEVPFLQFTLTIDLGRYLQVHDKLLQLDFDHLSPGHGKIGVKNDVKINKMFTMFVIQSAREAATGVDPNQVGTIFGRIANPNDVAYRNGAWALNSVVDLQVATCTRKVIAEWGCKLSVVDVLAKSHCLSAVIYLLLEQ